jgi:hypothetical protein
VRYVADKHFYEGDKFGAKLYQCNHCEHTFTWPILKPDELSELYSTRYNRQSAEFIARPRAGQVCTCCRGLGGNVRYSVFLRLFLLCVA